jgi:hypothetical protein
MAAKGYPLVVLLADWLVTRKILRQIMFKMTAYNPPVDDREAAGAPVAAGHP